MFQWLKDFIAWLDTKISRFISGDDDDDDGTGTVPVT